MEQRYMMASFSANPMKKNKVKRMKNLIKTKTHIILKLYPRLVQSKALENSRKKECMVLGVLCFIQMDQSMSVAYVMVRSMAWVQFLDLMDNFYTTNTEQIIS